MERLGWLPSAVSEIDPVQRPLSVQGLTLALLAIALGRRRSAGPPFMMVRRNGQTATACSPCNKVLARSAVATGDAKGLAVIGQAHYRRQ